ncbi:MAG: hypothetical protein ABSB96_10280 [Gaiellaceae bacterium]
MSRTQLSLVFISVIVGLPVSGVAVASVNTSNAETDYRSWTFKELGIAADTFRPMPVGFDRPTVIYKLPRYAHEGGASWWVLHLHLVIDTNPRSASGSAALISAGINQVGAAYIRLNSTRRNGHDVILVTEDGTLDGVVRHVVRGTHIDIWYSNYIPIPGVLPGRNELAFMVEQKNLVRTLAIMPDSSIEHTRLAPAQINLSERLSRTHIAVGELVRAQATIRNIGGRTANRVQIAVDSVPGALAVIGPDQRFLGSFKPNRVATASFLLRASRIGRFPIGISASSSINQRAALRYVEISASPLAHSTRTARPTSSSRALVAALSAAVALLGLLAVIGGVRLRAVAPWGAGLVTGAGTFALWHFVMGAGLYFLMPVAVVSLAIALLPARTVARRIRPNGALVLALLGVSALVIALNAVIIFVLERLPTSGP